MLYTCKYCMKNYETAEEAVACETKHEAEVAEAERKAKEKESRMEAVRVAKQAYVDALQAFYNDYPEEKPKAKPVWGPGERMLPPFYFGFMR